VYNGKLSNFWRHYYQGISALIYVIDSSGSERFEARSEILFKILAAEELKSIKVLILATKMDLPHAKSPDQVISLCGLANIKQEYAIYPCNALTGEGLFEGMGWLE